MSKEYKRTDEYYIFEKDIEEIQATLKELSVVRAESDEKDDLLDLATETLNHALTIIDIITIDKEALLKELSEEE